MQNCKSVQNNLPAYLHNELDSKNLTAMHEHLSQCQTCLQQEIELRATDRLLNKFPFEALPENFDWELQKKINHLCPPSEKVKPKFRRIIYAIAATLLFTVGLEYFIFQFMRSAQHTIQFSDYPTTQTVFKSEAASASRSSLLRRYADKFQKQKVEISIQKNL